MHDPRMKGMHVQKVVLMHQPMQTLKPIKCDGSMPLSSSAFVVGIS
jgi:hypothetical protein